MKRTMMFIIFFIALIVVIFVTFLSYATIMDYKPNENDILFESENPSEIVNDTLSLISWNTGYAGLDAGMDFFYDGGERTRTSQENYHKNLDVINLYIRNFNTDFILLQEVDKHSKRSYYTDQVKLFGESNPHHFYSFAINYDVKFVPVPIASPMGRVVSGIMTMSHAVPSSAQRISLPGDYSWPTRIFMLDRCILLERFPVKLKELVVINIHNSAFDAEGSLRKQQTARLREILLEEYEKGNYVVCGGDWNLNPPGFEIDDLQWDNNAKTIDPSLDNDFLPSDWTWAWPVNAPTNRDVDKAYEKGITPTTVIDFFVLSPNIESLEVKAIDLGFAHSDHHPVYCRVVLR